MVRLSGIMLCVIGLLIAQQGNEYNWVESLPKPYTLSEKEISSILPEFHKYYPDFYDRLKAFALWRVGTPYEIFKLGEGKEPDTDPIIRLDVADCTGYILTSLAFVQSNSWSEARAKMIDIHYKGDKQGKKKPDYLKRWHYTSDRILNNPYTVNITDQLLPPQKLSLITMTLNIKKDKSEYLPINWKSELSTHFIPSAEISTELLQSLPEICGVAFVRKSYWEKGLLIAHEGMILDNKDIVHASSDYGKIVRLPFMDYYFRDDGPLFDGIMIYKFVEN